MERKRRRIVRGAALVVVSLSAVMGMLLMGPTRGQGPQGPAARAVLAVAPVAGRNTRVDVDFAVPVGQQLARQPRLRVLDAQEELVELLPILIARREPAGVGLRELHTENYLPGTYRLRAEVDIITPEVAGGETTVTSPWVTFTIGDQ